MIAQTNAGTAREEPEAANAFAKSKLYLSSLSTGRSVCEVAPELPAEVTPAGMQALVIGPAGRSEPAELACISRLWAGAASRSSSQQTGTSECDGVRSSSQGCYLTQLLLIKHTSSLKQLA